MGMGCMMDGSADMMLERIDGRLAFIKAELKIRDGQSDAWNEFADALKATAGKHNAMMREHMEEMRSGEFTKKPLPERLEQQETHLAAHLEQIKAIREAVSKLYAVLDDKQKEEASEIVLSMMGMGGMSMGGMMGQGGMMYDRGMMGGQGMMGQGDMRHGPGTGGMMGR
jgi:LTXXQ motif family protein